MYPAILPEWGDSQAGGPALLKELLDHSFPPGPVMSGAVAPHIRVVRNVFRAQDAGETAILLQANVGLASGEYDSHLPDAIQEPRVAEVGQKIRRAVVIAVLVVVAVQELVNIERSAHTHAIRDQIRMAHCEIHGMVAAEAAAGYGDSRRSVSRVNERDDFIDQILIVLNLPRGTLCRVNGFVVPALRVHGIDAKRLELAVFVLAANHVDHPAIFIVE